MDAKQIRMVQLYTRWLYEREGLPPPRMGEIVPSNHGALIYGGEYVRFPGPDMDEWKRMNEAAKARAFAELNPAKPIRQMGITVWPRWEWTEARKREERENIRQLCRPWGWERNALTRFRDENRRKERMP